jgi:hypothetical protein
MVAAGRLERSNVCNYDEAASLAREGGLPELVEELREMAEVEREHERYFRERTRGHAVVRLLSARRGALTGRGRPAPGEATLEVRCPEARRR